MHIFKKFGKKITIQNSDKIDNFGSSPKPDVQNNEDVFQNFESALNRLPVIQNQSNRSQLSLNPSIENWNPNSDDSKSCDRDSSMMPSSNLESKNRVGPSTNLLYTKANCDSTPQSTDSHYYSAHFHQQQTGLPAQFQAHQTGFQALFQQSGMLSQSGFQNQHQQAGSPIQFQQAGLPNHYQQAGSPIQFQQAGLPEHYEQEWQKCLRPVVPQPNTRETLKNFSPMMTSLPEVALTSLPEVAFPTSLRPPFVYGAQADNSLQFNQGHSQSSNLGQSYVFGQQHQPSNQDWPSSNLYHQGGSQDKRQPLNHNFQSFNFSDSSRPNPSSDDKQFRSSQSSNFQEGFQHQEDLPSQVPDVPSSNYQEEQQIYRDSSCNVFVFFSELEYSGDLNSELVRYLNGPKQFIHCMVCYASHVLNSKLIQVNRSKYLYQ